MSGSHRDNGSMVTVGALKNCEMHNEWQAGTRGCAGYLCVTSALVFGGGVAGERADAITHTHATCLPAHCVLRENPILSKEKINVET